MHKLYQLIFQINQECATNSFFFFLYGKKNIKKSWQILMTKNKNIIMQQNLWAWKGNRIYALKSLKVQHRKGKSVPPNVHLQPHAESITLQSTDLIDRLSIEKNMWLLSS